MAGIKRASGSEEEKNPLSDVEVSDEVALQLTKVQRDIQRAELSMDRIGFQKMTPVYEKRRAIVKAIPKFWAVSLMNHHSFAFYAQHASDQLALSYLEDLWVARDPAEPRCYTIEFYFKENPFFTNTVLKKTYKYNAPATEDDKADEDGITEAMLDFSWERDVEALPTTIDWKDAEHTLTKLHPATGNDGDDDDDDVADMGTFFNFFEKGPDPFDIGIMIASDVFPDAVDHFFGQAGDDEDLESDSDDEDDEDEIDLEKPRTKKQKV